MSIPVRPNGYDSAWVLYDDSYKFNEGIYLSAQDLRYDRPSIPLDSLEDAQGRRIEGVFDGNKAFVDGVGTNKRIYVRSRGERWSIALDDVWGYCRGDLIAIRMPSDFFVGLRSWFHVEHMGTIAILAAYHGEKVTFAEKLVNGDLGGAGNSTEMNVMLATMNDHPEQGAGVFFFDMRTWAIYDWHKDDMAEVIQDDEELANEFRTLSRRGGKRARLPLRFIVRYNERHPLYFQR